MMAALLLVPCSSAWRVATLPVALALIWANARGSWRW